MSNCEPAAIPLRAKIPMVQRSVCHVVAQIDVGYSQIGIVLLQRSHSHPLAISALAPKGIINNYHVNNN